MSQISQVELMKQAFKYQNGLVSYAYGYLRDWSLAEDAVQEAFLVLMEKWQEFKPELGVFPWVRKMVFYKVQELQRARRRELPVEDQELRDLVSRTLEGGFDEAAGRGHEPLLKAYEDCLGRLNKGSADLLVRYYWDRESSEQIAGALNRTVNAVWLSLSRIRKSLRECVARRQGELGVAP
jgi:RNA polymerase sigma-70 factor (ECF subfamily)